jgi:hypothetical protein
VVVPTDFALCDDLVAPLRPSRLTLRPIHNRLQVRFHHGWFHSLAQGWVNLVTNRNNQTISSIAINTRRSSILVLMRPWARATALDDPPLEDFPLEQPIVRREKSTSTRTTGILVEVTARSNLLL